MLITPSPKSPRWAGGGPGPHALALLLCRPLAASVHPVVVPHDPHIALLHMTPTCPCSVPTQWSPSPKGAQSTCPEQDEPRVLSRPWTILGIEVCVCGGCPVAFLPSPTVESKSTLPES